MHTKQTILNARPECPRNLVFLKMTQDNPRDPMLVCLDVYQYVHIEMYTHVGGDSHLVPSHLAPKL